ncbi:MAG: hypothetical protein AAGA84_11675 [Pseudomonadota bacterium]
MQQHADLPIGRIVLLGTPVVSAAAALRVASLDGADGEMAQSLTRQSFDWSLPGIQIGAIAGTMAMHQGRQNDALAAPHDGVVSVEETQWAGLADHLTLAVPHAGLVTSREVADRAVRFLQHGAFKRTD